MHLYNQNLFLADAECKLESSCTNGNCDTASGTCTCLPEFVKDYGLCVMPGECIDILLIIHETKSEIRHLKCGYMYNSIP